MSISRTCFPMGPQVLFPTLPPPMEDILGVMAVKVSFMLRHIVRGAMVFRRLLGPPRGSSRGASSGSSRQIWT